MPADAAIIQVEHLVRKFGDRAVLDDISFNVHRGETLVIMGGSGCGKSTLLRQMIGAMKPTSGCVKLFGEEITTMKERELERVRLRFGMLFQSGALLASLTVSEASSAPDWNSIPNRRRTRSSSRSFILVISSPKSFTQPEVGFMAPIICRSRVLLPQPLPPIITSVSPR